MELNDPYTNTVHAARVALRNAVFLWKRRCTDEAELLWLAQATEALVRLEECEF
jgi:hypothetical protein